ncbi:hypothetical protein [Nocardioides sp. AN3]
MAFTAAIVAGVIATVTGCAASPNTGAAAAGTGIGADGAPVSPLAGAGTLGPGFVTPSAPPPPGGTMTPSPGSWVAASPPKGYRVVLLTTEEDRTARTLSTAVVDWAREAHVDLVRVVADNPMRYVASIQSALHLDRDLIVTVGNGLVDPLALVSASWLDQRFLVLGAELAEPTANVTAADWKGASYRGEGLGTASTYDAASFTPERGARAVRAGVAAVVAGYSGYVVWVD